MEVRTMADAFSGPERAMSRVFKAPPTATARREVQTSIAALASDLGITWEDNPEDMESLADAVTADYLAAHPDA